MYDQVMGHGSRVTDLYHIILCIGIGLHGWDTVLLFGYRQ